MLCLLNRAVFYGKRQNIHLCTHQIKSFIQFCSCEWTKLMAIFLIFTILHGIPRYEFYNCSISEVCTITGNGWLTLPVASHLCSVNYENIKQLSITPITTPWQEKVGALAGMFPFQEIWVSGGKSGNRRELNLICIWKYQRNCGLFGSLPGK